MTDYVVTYFIRGRLMTLI